MIRVITDLLAI